MCRLPGAPWAPAPPAASHAGLLLLLGGHDRSGGAHAAQGHPLPRSEVKLSAPDSKQWFWAFVRSHLSHLGRKLCKDRESYAYSVIGFVFFAIFLIWQCFYWFNGLSCKENLPMVSRIRRLGTRLHIQLALSSFITSSIKLLSLKWSNIPNEEVSEVLLWLFWGSLWKLKGTILLVN